MSEEIGLRDRISAGLLLGVLLWILDHGLTVVSYTFTFSPRAEAWFLILIAITATVAPFWMARGVFSTSIWATLPHSISDRIWAAVFASSVQLGFDVLVLNTVSPGKILISVIYAVSCSFGAVSGYRMWPSIAHGDGAPNELLVSQLKVIRSRGNVAFISALLALGITRIIVPLNILTLRGIVCLLIVTVGSVLAAMMYLAVQYRCPGCGRSLMSRDRKDCRTCRAETQEGGL